MKLPNADQMRLLDAAAINDYGVPGAVLMENAGQGAVQCVFDRYGQLQGREIAIMIGPGNNGGDGFVMARHFLQHGAKPFILLAAEFEKIRGDAAINGAVVRKLPIPLYAATDAKGPAALEIDKLLGCSTVIVDALFGTGLKREISGHYAELIRAANRSGKPVVAVDMPSGLDTDTGQPLGACVKADMTVTFGFAKPGMYLQPGASYCGTVRIVDIGIPPEALARADVRVDLLVDEMVAPWMPLRQANDHKGTFGHLFIVAGSKGKTGAAVLAVMGGLRSGAGLVTLCTPGCPQTITSAVPEAMTVVLPDSNPGHFTLGDYVTVKKAATGKSCLAIGPGMGTDADTAELIRNLYVEVEAPMIMDADGLNILAMDTSLLKEAKGPRILTPHPGEMARLTGLTSGQIQRDRIGTAVRFAGQHGVHVVLKGAATVVASPEGEAAVNSTGNPGMATGGMGDVLAGFIGGLLAQGLSCRQAACLGVFAHGLAADLIVEDRGGYPAGLTASEVAVHLPLAMNMISADGKNK